ncbi:hypothetical protein RIF29_19906 [Crotalaria pallida]|uniref:Uncharacterized protein n=1 Tax=Crotalaria pallida TaxID=3830 RepID=A0AAN9F0B5_CROPI
MMQELDCCIHSLLFVALLKLFLYCGKILNSIHFIRHVFPYTSKGTSVPEFDSYDDKTYFVCYLINVSRWRLALMGTRSAVNLNK